MPKRHYLFLHAMANL